MVEEILSEMCVEVFTKYIPKKHPPVVMRCEDFKCVVGWVNGKARIIDRHA